MVTEIVLLVIALLMLLVGANASLDASEKVGKLFGIPPLIIGLMIIGFGTSLPEFFVSHISAVNGKVGMSIGNIVGSNISNLLIVLGLSVFIQRIEIKNPDLQKQINIHLILTFIFSGVLLFSKLYVLSCLVLITFFVVHLFHTYQTLQDRKAELPSREELEEIEDIHYTTFARVKVFIKLLVGFILLYFGGELLVKSGSKICELIGISEYIISAIFIALGTSLPELITSLMAVYKKKDLDMIIGNVIGSNIFNVSFVLGSLVFYDVDFNRTFYMEIGVLILSSLIIFIHSYKTKHLGKTVGTLFIALYSLMTYYWVTQS